MADDKFTSLDAIYGYLNPISLNDSAPQEKVTDLETFDTLLMRVLLNKSGGMTSWPNIRAAITSYLTDAPKEVKEKIKKTFHAIGTDGLIAALKDENYFVTTSNATGLFGLGSDSKRTAPAVVFTTRSPHFSPAKRGTSAVDFFLNHIPSVFASQMVPYLDVEMQINRNSSYLSTPSQLRFLLGSVPTTGKSSPLTDADAAMINVLERTKTGSDGQKKDASLSFSGMEMFLSPQTLTNMDALVGNGRLTRVKPFVPFASIDAFDIAIANAGAGKIVHKKATLKLRVHDKARIAEISQFVRGPVGLNEAVVWTTYGWSAPRGRGPDDAYAKFINENMSTRDCWTPMNASFSFDAAGQVILTIELVSKALTQFQDASLSADVGIGSSTDAATKLKTLGDIVQTLAKFQGESLGMTGPGLGVEVRAMQILNATSVAGVLRNLDGIDDALDALTRAENSGAVTKTGIKGLKDALAKLKSTVVSEDDFVKSLASAVQKKFEDCGSGDDFFLTSYAPQGTAASRRKEFFDPDIEAPLNDAIAASSGLFVGPGASEKERDAEARKDAAKEDAAKKQADVANLARGLMKKNPALSEKDAFAQAKAEIEKTDNEAAIKKAKEQTEKNEKKTPSAEPPATVAEARAQTVKQMEDAKRQRAAFAASRAKKTTPTIKPGSSSIVSFGKIFCRMIMSSILAQPSEKDVEYQVVFHSLNDQCGPVSGHSIAEFPIDLRVLAYAYYDTIRNTGRQEMSAQEFLTLIISSQFADNRAPGYGLAFSYLPTDPDNPTPSPRNNSRDVGVQARLAEWTLKYGSLKQPIIDVLVETGTESDRGSDNIDWLDRIRTSQKDAQGSETSSPVSSNRIIKRVHVYDRQSDPNRAISDVFRFGDDSGWLMGKVDVGKKTALINKLVGSNVRIDSNKLRALIESGKKTADALKEAGAPPDVVDDITNLTYVTNSDGSTTVKVGNDREAIRDALARAIPTIRIGSNGTMIYTATMASKLDGQLGTINYLRSIQQQPPLGATLDPRGLENPNHLPLQLSPSTLSMTSAGCPIAQLYQQYFIDFNTGTTLDNLYVCNQVQHSFSPGKFTTTWSFIYYNGYGKFAVSPAAALLAKGSAEDILAEAMDKILPAPAETKAAGKKKTPAAKKR